jgi:hypothetical protein
MTRHPETVSEHEAALEAMDVHVSDRGQGVFAILDRQINLSWLALSRTYPEALREAWRYARPWTPD